MNGEPYLWILRMRRVVGILRLLCDQGGIKLLIAVYVARIDVLGGLAVWSGKLRLDGLELGRSDYSLGCEVLELVLDGIERAGDACLVVAHFEGLKSVRVGRCAGGTGG